MPDIFVYPRQWTAQPTGAPYAGAQLYFYQAGTFVQQTVYQDFTLTTPHDQPIEADDGGKFPVIFLNGAAEVDYRIVLRNRFGTLIDDIDNVPRSSVTTTEIGRAINPQTPAEDTSGVTPTDYTAGPYPYNLARIGLVPNSAGAAAANTVAIKALLDPTKTGITGRVFSPNTTGSDIYYFNDIIPIRDGVHLDLCGCTLHFSKTAAANDTGSGFIFALRDFSIENGSIVVDYDMTGVATSAGSPIQIGTRGTDSVYFTVWDSLLDVPMGNITLRNLRIDSNNPDGNGILLTGGISGLIAENIVIEGNDVLGGGIYYEFGWATSGTTNLRETSHAHNLRFNNINVKNLSTSKRAGLTLTGAYNYEVDGLKVTSAAAVFTATPGESLNYRPWASNDVIGAKRNMQARNLIGQEIIGTGITLTGAQLASGGYLSALGLTAVSETDLADYSLDGFAIDGTNAGFGLNVSAGRAAIKNGRITGFQEGIRGTDEWTLVDIDNIKITGCTRTGINLDGGTAIWSPTRGKVGSIKHCFIAGNGTSTPNGYPGISLGHTDSFLIESNRLNYETAHDGADETTQGNAVQLAATASGVVCKANRVGVVQGGSFAYYNVTTTTANDNTVENATGVVTQSGAWLNTYNGVGADVGDADKTLTVGSHHRTQRWATTLTGNRTVTLSTTGAKQGDAFRIVRTGLGSFTLAVGALKTIPSATAAFVDVEYNGSAWVLSGYGAL